MSQSVALDQRRVATVVLAAVAVFGLALLVGSLAKGSSEDSTPTVTPLGDSPSAKVHPVGTSAAIPALRRKKATASAPADTGSSASATPSASQGSSGSTSSPSTSAPSSSSPSASSPTTSKPKSTAPKKDTGVVVGGD